MEEVPKTVCREGDFKVVASQLVHKLREAEAQVPPEENHLFTLALCAAESASVQGKYVAHLMYMEGTIMANHWPTVHHCKPILLVTDDYKFFKAFVRSSYAKGSRHHCSQGQSWNLGEAGRRDHPWNVSH